MSFFRVTSQTFTQQSLQSIQLHNQRLATLQSQISTGQRIQRPSDDPTAYREWKLNEAEVNRLEAYLKNIAAVRSQLDSQVTQLIGMKEQLVRATTLTQEAPGSTEPAALATEVASIREALLELVNAQQPDGKYVFAGDAYDRQPYVRQGSGASARIVYQGSTQSAVALVGREALPAVHLSGEDIFRLSNRGQTFIVGKTGAVSGSGTSNGEGFADLTVTHVLTTFAAGSGVQAGTDSASGDTVIGPAGSHTLRITDTSGAGASGVVSLNGGAEVAFSNTDTNLRVEGPLGEVVYLDTTNIGVGFSGTVDITATGTMSTDGGATTIAINHTGDQILTNSLTGAITHVDSTSIRLTGTDRIEYQGTADVFEVLDQLQRDLVNAGGLETTDQQDAFQRRLGELQGLVDTVLGAVNQQSSTLANLDALEKSHQDTQLNLEERTTAVAGTDFATAVAELQQEQLLLQYTYATTAQLTSLSLLEFLV